MGLKFFLSYSILKSEFIILFYSKNKTGKRRLYIIKSDEKQLFANFQKDLLYLQLKANRKVLK